MKRRLKILGIIVAALLAVAGITGVIIVRTEWFREFVRTKVIAAVEKSTGGKVEIGSFQFDWTQLRVEIRDFVLHGTEPAGEDPLLRAQRIAIDLRYLSVFRQRKVDISSLEIDRLLANLIVLPDGKTNVPRPDIPEEPGDKSGLETVVDLAVGRLVVTNSLLKVSDRKIPLELRGEDFRAELDYELTGQRYAGQISLNPLLLTYGKGQRLPVTLRLPVVIEADRIELNNADVRTPNSAVSITASVEDLKDPKVSVRTIGELDVPELLAAAGQAANGIPQNGLLRKIQVDVDASTEDKRFQIRTAKLGWGQSTAEATGEFANTALENGSVNLRAHLVLDDLKRLQARPTFQGGGSLDVQAVASVENLDKITIDPIRVDAVGGRITARAQLLDLDRYEARGNLSGFQMRQVLALVGTRGATWNSGISGSFTAAGSMKTARTTVAQAKLSLAAVPRSQGIPLNGNLDVAYTEATDVIMFHPSYLTLPASRVDFSGALNNRLSVQLTSRNLDDFLPALALASDKPPSNIPVRFQPGGSLTFDAILTGQIRAPQISGTVALSRFTVEGRRFDLLAADFGAAQSGAQLRNAVLTGGSVQARLNGSIGLNQWKTDMKLPLTVNIDIPNADMQDLLALAGQSDTPVRGRLAMSAQVGGTLGDPQGAATVSLRQGSAYGESVETADGQIALGRGKITVSSLQATSNTARATLSGVFEHPIDSYSTGRLTGRVVANDVALLRVAAVQKQRPGLDGALQLNLNVQAELLPPGSAERIELTNADGNVGVQQIRYAGEDLGNAQAQIQTTGKEVRFNLESNLADSSLRANGVTTLTSDYPTTANIDLKNLRVERILKLAGLDTMKAKGQLSAEGQVTGTLRSPTGDLNILFINAEVDGQPLDRLVAKVSYQETLVRVASLELQSGPNRVTGEAELSHPVETFSRGNWKLAINTNGIQLAQVKYLQDRKPGLGGVVSATIAAEGSLDQSRTTPVLPSALTADLNGQSLSLEGRDYGQFALTAKQSGQAVDFSLRSNVAQSQIQGSGQVRLVGDYPMTADVALREFHYRNWAALLSPGQNDLRDDTFDAVVEGNLKVAGPATRPAELTGTAQFERVEFVGRTRQDALKTTASIITLKNQGPVVLAATQRGIEIQRARWTGPSTDVALSGRVAIQPQVALDLVVKANVNLALVQEFDRNVRGDGIANIDASVKGSLAEPVIAGRLELKDAGYQQSSVRNGISHANGAIVFSGTTARIEELVAESGGGELSFTGGVTRLNGVYRFDISGKATDVRILTPVEVSVVADGRFKLTGTDTDSLLSGNIDVQTVSYNTRTDFGSILSRTSAPRSAPVGTHGFLDHMRLQIGIRAGSSTMFRTTLAENLQATADLTLRGMAANPGMLGRVEITRGQLLFFGTKYSINEATVSFYNPSKIEPILNLNLATTARGVDVSLAVTGSVENMNLSYHSDPPLQFSEIVALLAAGKLPTSDPILLAHQEPSPAQSLPQMGASALVSAAVTNPVAGRLQRVFGVTQLKIDPTFTSGSELPQARLTLQQQITSELTFTYVTNLTRPDSQIVRVEWVIDNDWSAIATRQENGMVGVDLFYKRRFQ